jgi:dihydroflavonol-4-reductase
MANETVLVTGGSGFIAVYCILQLLAEGYTVRTTVRSDAKEQLTREMLKAASVDPGNRLSFFRADLSSDAGWGQAAEGCRFVIHGASPTPNTMTGAEENWIAPARDGMLRVLRAAKSAGVTRVVLTSASGTIAYRHKKSLGRPFNEEDWTDTTANIPPYQKSKTLAEKAAWDFVAKEGKGLELATVHPVAVLGPVLGQDFSHSITIIQRMMNGLPRIPKVNSGFVDVRDVAVLHVRAMTAPAANGQRFLAISGHSLWFIDLARMLRKRLGKRARRVSTRELPNWIVRLAALRDPNMRMMAAQVGKVMDASNAKAERLLGWHPRPAEDSLVDTAESLIRFGLVKA